MSWSRIHGPIKPNHPGGNLKGGMGEKNEGPSGEDLTGGEKINIKDMANISRGGFGGGHDVIRTGRRSGKLMRSKKKKVISTQDK